MLMKTASKNYSIAIIGGGIGGLTAANALLHKNLTNRITVYEKASHFIPSAGAGFGFSPNGQICLRSIGIGGFHKFCLPFNHMKRIDLNGRNVMCESNALQLIRERHGFGIAGCLRGDLIDLLSKELQRRDGELKYSQKLIGIDMKQDKVELKFESGHEDIVDLVIGADGINSTVAKLLDIDDKIPPIYSGANIFYGKIPNPNDHELLRSNDIFNEGSVVNGPGTGEQYSSACFDVCQSRLSMHLSFRKCHQGNSLHFTQAQKRIKCSSGRIHTQQQIHHKNEMTGIMVHWMN